MKCLKFNAASLGSVIAIGLFATTIVVAQSPAPPPPPNDMMMQGPAAAGDMMHGGFGEGQAVKGVPLSGDFTVSRETVLADGNRIHNDSQSRVYRDSEGRVRREMGLDLATPATGNVKRDFVVIIDPVAGKRYMLNPDNKTAREMPLRGPRGDDKHHEEHMKAMSGFANSQAPQNVQLGSKAVNGLQAEGVRVIRTIPAGAIGNEKPIEVVTERWYSSDLQIAVMTVHTDPMMGTVTTKLTNVTRAEPDASLFQIPADYKVDVGKPNQMMYMPMKP